jgi:hypothetical protein
LMQCCLTCLINLPLSCIVMQCSPTCMISTLLSLFTALNCMVALLDEISSYMPDVIITNQNIKCLTWDTEVRFWFRLKRNVPL